jgi:hypothetical protein
LIAGKLLGFSQDPTAFFHISRVRQRVQAFHTSTDSVSP